MNKIIIPLLLVAGFFGFRFLSKPKTIKLDAGATATLFKSKECSNKKVCILYFVAPWCPHCSRLSSEFIPTLQGVLKEKFNHVGLLYIIGQDKQKAANEFATSHGVKFFIYDDKDTYYKRFKFKSIPSFAVLSSAGKVRLIGSEYRMSGTNMADAAEKLLTEKFLADF